MCTTERRADGLFLPFEGLDGSGKSTQMRLPRAAVAVACEGPGKVLRTTDVRKGLFPIAGRDEGGARVQMRLPRAAVAVVRDDPGSVLLTTDARVAFLFPIADRDGVGSSVQLRLSAACEDANNAIRSTETRVAGLFPFARRDGGGESVLVGVSISCEDLSTVLRANEPRAKGLEGCGGSIHPRLLADREDPNRASGPITVAGLEGGSESTPMRVLEPCENRRNVLRHVCN